MGSSRRYCSELGGGDEGGWCFTCVGVSVCVGVSACVGVSVCVLGEGGM